MKTFVTAVVAAVLLASSGAHAAKGIVVSRDGQVLSGRIVEIVNGDHLTIELPNGQVQTLPWSEVFTVKLEEAPAPAPTPAYEPPAPLVMPAPAPTLRDQSPPPSTSSDASQGVRPEIAVSVGMVSMSGDLLEANGKSIAASDFVGQGWAFRADAGLRVSRAWTFYGTYEYDGFGKGDQSSMVDHAPTGHGAGVGFKAISNPRGPVAFLFDIGAGWRWLRFPSGNNAMAVAGGPEPLRVGLGISLVASPRAHFDLTGNMAVGQLTRFALPDGMCVNPNASDCDTVPESSRTWHVTRSLMLGGTFTL